MEGVITMKRKLLLLMTTLFLLCFMCIPAMAATVATAEGAPVSGITPTETASSFGVVISQADKIGDSNDYGVVVPVTVTQSGYFELYAQLYDQSTVKDLRFELFVDPACTTNPTDGCYASLSDSYPSDESSSYLAPGTYYLKISTYASQPTNLVVGGAFAVRHTSNEDRVVTSGSQVLMSKRDGGVYLKYKAPKNGYLTTTFTGGDYSSMIYLCNSSKKVISDSAYTSATMPRTVFAVKKNTTYYIKIDAIDDITAYKISFTAVTEKSGSKISKAVAIKKGKTVKGLILPGDSKKDYFKLTVSKAQVVKIQVKGDVSSGIIKVNIYGDKAKKRSIGSIWISEAGYNRKYTIYTIGSKKLRKGTYYFSVERANKKTNGQYSIKWMK